MKTPSKTKRIAYGTLAGLGIFAGAAGIASAATGQSDTTNPSAATEQSVERNESPESTFKSSVTVPDTGKDAELSDAAEAEQFKGLAKINEDQAKDAALKAVPGSVKEIELENEDGNVVYEVEVKGTDGKVTEVIVDAGDGKVLHQELEDDEEDCEKGGGEHENGTKESDRTDTKGGDVSSTPTTAAPGN